MLTAGAATAAGYPNEEQASCTSARESRCAATEIQHKTTIKKKKFNQIQRSREDEKCILEKIKYCKLLSVADFYIAVNQGRHLFFVTFYSDVLSNA